MSVLLHVPREQSLSYKPGILEAMHDFWGQGGGDVWPDWTTGCIPGQRGICFGHEYGKMPRVNRLAVS